MTFSDIFKSDFLSKVSSFSILDTAIAMLVAFAIGIFIFVIYKKTFSGVMYSASFGISLIAMALITALIIQAVTSNVILSLGMVGALSIVRFRTAVKEPLDIAFLFWAISAGIVAGAGLIPLALIGSVFIGIILLIFANHKNTDTPYMLIVQCSSDACEKDVLDAVSHGSRKYFLKAKNVNASRCDLTIELKLDESTKLCSVLSQLPGVLDVSLMSFNGEYMS